MRLTIIPGDRAVYVDGAAVVGVSVVAPAGVRALQWKESRGWIEYDTGAKNEVIEVLPQWANDAVGARAQKIADAAAAANTPPTAEQLEAEAKAAKLQAAAAEIKQDTKVREFIGMTPTEARAWVKTVGAEEALATLAVTVSVLAGRL